MLALLSVMCSLDREVAHLPFDDSRIASVSAYRIEFACHLGQQHGIVIITMHEGENAPVSRFWTG